MNKEKLALNEFINDKHYKYSHQSNQPNSSNQSKLNKVNQLLTEYNKLVSTIQETKHQYKTVESTVNNKYSILKKKKKKLLRQIAKQKELAQKSINTKKILHTLNNMKREINAVNHEINEKDNLKSVNHHQFNTNPKHILKIISTNNSNKFPTISKNGVNKETKSSSAADISNIVASLSSLDNKILKDKSKNNSILLKNNHNYSDYDFQNLQTKQNKDPLFNNIENTKSSNYRNITPSSPNSFKYISQSPNQNQINPQNNDHIGLNKSSNKTNYSNANNDTSSNDSGTYHHKKLWIIICGSFGAIGVLIIVINVILVIIYIIIK